MKAIGEFDCVKNWMLNVSAGTRSGYLRHFAEFCQFTGLDPDQLLAEGRTDREAVHNMAKRFYAKLEAEGVSSTTRSNAYTSVRSFYKWHNLRLGVMPRHFAGMVQHESERILQPHEISRMVSEARSVRDKAIISFLTQSGQRVGILTAMRYFHVRDQLEKGVAPIVIDVKGELQNAHGLNVNKYRVPYRFAVGKECTDYLRRMIEERRKDGEPIDNNTWLFRSYSKQIVTENGQTVKRLLRRVSKSEKGYPLNIFSLTTLIRDIAAKAGIQQSKEIGLNRRGKPKVKYEVHAHTFRRWWKHQMREGGMKDAEMLNFMLGHKMPYGAAYDKFPPEMLRREYTKAEPFVTVMVNPDVQRTIERTRNERLLVSKGIDPQAERARHPDWNDSDYEGWLTLMVRESALHTSSQLDLEGLVPDLKVVQYGKQNGNGNGKWETKKIGAMDEESYEQLVAEGFEEAGRVNGSIIMRRKLA